MYDPLSMNYAIQQEEEEMRRAARTDDNQHELVEALKKIGAKCYFIGKPVDLLVGFRGRNMLLEVKRPDKRGQESKITQEQKDFIATWPGEVVRSEEHTSELQSLTNLVCRLLLEKKKQ